MTHVLNAHPTDDELVLLYYGEEPRAAAIRSHLSGCAACAATFEEIAVTLSLVAETPIPERGEHYGLEVWQRLRPELPANRPLSWWPRATWPIAAALAAVAVLVLAAFVAGQRWRAVPAPALAPIAVAPAPYAEQEVRLVALVDHLEQSERVLVDLTHAPAQADVIRTQQWAEGLVDANRLHREAAQQAGDATVAAVLDDLERTLLDIVHAPATPTAAELEAARARLDAAALLFKVRILSNELRERETAPLPRRKTI